MYFCFRVIQLSGIICLKYPQVTRGFVLTSSRFDVRDMPGRQGIQEELGGVFQRSWKSGIVDVDVGHAEPGAAEGGESIVFPLSYALQTEC